MAALNFKCTDYEAKAIDYPLLPKGEFIAEIIDIELKKTNLAIKNDTNDCYLNITFKILTEAFSGRFVWDKLNIVNSGTHKKEVEEIGRGTLRTIAKILNLEDVLDRTMDTDCLIGGTLGIKVDVSEFIDKKTNQEKKSNIIKSYKDPKHVKANPMSNRGNLAAVFNSPANESGMRFPHREEIQGDREINDDIPF